MITITHHTPDVVSVSLYDKQHITAGIVDYFYYSGEDEPNYPMPAIPLHLEFVSNTLSGVYGSGLFSPDNLECYALWFKD